MRRPGRWMAWTVILSLALSVGLAPAARAQDECSLVSVAEVEAAFGVSGLESSGSGTLCSFSGTTTLVVAVQPGADLEAQKAQDPAGVEASVADLPAWISEASRTLYVAVNGQVLGLSYYGDATWDVAEPALMSLAALAIPRVPAGPDPADVARLEALVPATIDGQPVTVRSFSGGMLLGFLDQSTPSVIALNEALAAQGKTAADILFVGGETGTDDDYGVTAVLIKGADASSLIEPMFRAFLGDAGEPTFTTQEIGGKQVTVVTTDVTLYVRASGDVLVGVSAPEAELATIIGGLP